MQSWPAEAWYAAAWSGEVNRSLLGRRMLEENVLLYRTEAGDPVAIQNRCPHRFAPLDKGRLHGDVVECAYHGLRFDRTGMCTLNPHGPTIPPTACVRAFPVIERHGLVWIWPGAAAAANPGLVPDLPHLQSAGFKNIDGMIEIDGYYEIITDNLLDLSHTQYLHEDFLASALLDARRSLTVEGHTLILELRCPAGPAIPFARPFLADPDEPVVQLMRIRFDPPTVIQIAQTITPISGQGEQFHIGTHLLTPIDENSTRYFYGSSRTFGVDDPKLDAAIRHWHRVGFGEQDKPMIEAVQQQMGTNDLMSLRPVLLPSDTAATRARSG